MDEELASKSKEDFERIVEGKKEQKTFYERRIAKKALQVLRYILRKGGAIDENTVETRFSPLEKKATHQLIASGWLKAEEGIWRSPSFHAMSFLLGIIGVFSILNLLSNVFHFQLLQFFKWIGNVMILLLLTPTLVLLAFGTFYSHWFKKIKLPEKTIKMLTSWSRLTGNHAKYYGAMEGENIEEIREGIYTRLHRKIKQMKK